MQMKVRENASVEKRAAAVVEAIEASGRLPEGALESQNDVVRELDWRNGSRVVARAWTDPEFKKRLLADGTAASAEMGFSGPEGEYIVVVEDSPGLKNVIVCTQCSCTAWPVLGLPPDWYKDPAYRAQVVRHPRRVLEEMGVSLASDVRIRVWDTTAESRFLVLPLQPQGTNDWTEDQLAAIVTREAMIGVALVQQPG
jgi:nitrile hydratase